MRVGLLVTGDVSVRAAHSLQAHPSVTEVVVIGPATSKSFEVVSSAAGCDFLVGSGATSPAIAADHDVPLIWDGHEAAAGALVWGASPQGFALALAARESDTQLVAVAHPGIDDDSTSSSTRFPDPVGRLGTREEQIDGRPLAVAHSTNDFGACLVVSADRRVTVVDHGAFMSGVALAAGIAAIVDGGPVWAAALPYLEAATEMGLVMAERN